METHLKHFNWGMHKDNVVLLHNRLFPVDKINEIMKNTGNCKELEKTNLILVTQTQKQKHGMYSLISFH